ncbi:MAG: cytochrome c [Psychromonas sp.]|nr:cytochrome c [Psychromonas sp.]
MKKIILVVSLLFISSISSADMQHNPNANFFKSHIEATKYRQDAFSMMSVNFHDMATMLKGKKKWDQAEFQTRANNVHNISTMIEDGFKGQKMPKGQTKAKPDIWTNWADFSSKLQHLRGSTLKLADVSKTGNKKAIKSEFKAVGQLCGACHKKYRNK